MAERQLQEDPIYWPDIYAELEDLKGRELSIIHLSKPITSALAGDDDDNNTTTTTITPGEVKSKNHNDKSNSNSAPVPQQQRTSDVSTSSLDANAPTPASLEADLIHYRELFAKLRFSYVEQVTKEKFIRSIVGDPPVIVTPQDNLSLETDNLTAKNRLKKLKSTVADTVKELERMGRDLCRRWECVQIDTVQLRHLPEEISGLEQQIWILRAALDPEPGEHPSSKLPLEQTLKLGQERRKLVGELDRELLQLRSEVPGEIEEVRRLELELAALIPRARNSTAAAAEAKKRKEDALGGVQDDLEERGRFWIASDYALGAWLAPSSSA